MYIFTEIAGPGAVTEWGPAVMKRLKVNTLPEEVKTAADKV